MVVHSILLWASLVIAFFAYAWILFYAFKDNVFWGVALLFAPLAAPAAAATTDIHWFAYVPFGLLLIFVGFNLFETYKAFLITMTAVALFAWSGTGLDTRSKSVTLTLYDAVMSVFSSEGRISFARSYDDKKLTAVESARRANELMLKRIEQMHRAGMISDQELAQARMDFERQLAKLQESMKQNPAAGSTQAGQTTGGQTASQTSPPAGSESGSPATQGGDTQADTTTASNPAGGTSGQEHPPLPEEIPVAEASKYIGVEMEVTEDSGRKRTGKLLRIDGGRLYFKHEKRTGGLEFMVYDTHIDQLKPVTE